MSTIGTLIDIYDSIQIERERKHPRQQPPNTIHIHYVSPWDFEADYRGQFVQQICDRRILHIYQPIRHQFIAFHTARFLCRIAGCKNARRINRLFLKLFHHPLF